MMKKKKNIADSEELLIYKEMARGASDIRQEKIDEIKKKIESGEYKVDAEAIANKMLELAKDINCVPCRKNPTQNK